MKFEISDEIIEATTECRKGFRCLREPVECLCKVEACIRDSVHFIRCEHILFCSYKIPFGKGYVCSCPTRKEIFNRYKE